MMMMMMPPEHWKTVKLGDVIDIKNGKNQSLVLSEKGLYPILGSAGNLMGYATDYICEAGTTIIGRKGNISKPIFVNENFWNVDTAFGFYPKDTTELDKKFIFYLCLNTDFAKLNRGTTIPSLVKSELQAISIPLPPLQEQRRIVAILDEAFTALEQAKANVACNKANARAVFESVLNTIFNPTTQDDQQGWKTVKLGDIALKIGSGSTPRGGQESYKTEGIPLIRSLNVHDRTFKYKNLAFLDELQAKSLANVTVQEGDVLLNITGASVARCCLVVQDVVPARVNQHVSIIRVSQDKIQPEFLEYLLTSTFYKNALLGVGESGGTTRQAITKTELESFRIKFPNSLQQQRDIVDSVKQVERFTQALEAMYNKKLTAIDELKQALLHHAFTGQLTTPARHVECNETSLYHVQDDKLLQEALHP